MSPRPRSRFLLLLLLLAALSTQARAQEQVSFPGRGNVSLKAKLYKPEGAGPFPAIVALHGCGGPWASRDSDWAARLSSAGFIVIFPDSFGSRGLGSQCQVRDRGIRPRDRAEDAFATAEWFGSAP